MSKDTIDHTEMDLIYLLASEGGGVACDDERVERFSEDRGQDDDTINRCIDKKWIYQSGDPDLDNFYLRFNRTENDSLILALCKKSYSHNQVRNDVAVALIKASNTVDKHQTWMMDGWIKLASDHLRNLVGSLRHDF